MEMRPHGPEGLPQPPSAKSARTFGILGICSHLLCLLGAPFAILFGILALVRHGRAKREHAADPETYARPKATGLVTGIVALAMLVMVLPTTGIVAAIAIPAVQGQRERARNLAEQVEAMRETGTINGVMALLDQAAFEVDLTAQVLRGRSAGLAADPREVVQTVLSKPAFRYPAAKNSYGGTESPFRLGDTPRMPGEITLDPVPDHLYPTGARWPAVIIRGQYRQNGQPVVVSKVVALD